MVISIYVHIPLCRRKCPYCHFFTIPDEARARGVLLEGLALEWERVRSFVDEREVVSLYFGGGTPWLLGPKGVGEVIEWIGRWGEVTLEANPDDVTAEGVRAFADVGVNRLSLGVQSLDEKLLMGLGRAHSAQRAKEAVFEAALGGIENVSIDLMYDIPNQTKESWEATLDGVAQLPVSHLSLYNLTFEPRTVFFKRKRELERLLPQDELSTEMLERACTRLEEMGLKRYEISAFAKEGRESVHNMGYWTGREFLGLGPSAFSFVDGRRFQNVAHVGKYLRALKAGRSAIDFEERLSYQDHLNEKLAVGLRVLSGIDVEGFPKATLERLVKEGYLEQVGTRVRLTAKGTLFYDTVATEII